ncbi:MAG: Zn-finger domain associated with topoisomerase type [Verrucomicrobiales bacterium]|nr:Zn-finger domain associated with topoisomerase type [Verrucomicrobiales bacterium]
MSNCSYCGSKIILGGVRSFDLRFCNQKCAQSGALLNVSIHIPDEVVQSKVINIHKGSCPICTGPGPVDVHTSYAIWSAIVVSCWKNTPRISCVSCARKARIEDAIRCFFFGWWGFPNGIIRTPIQLGRNIVGLIKAKTTNPPSAHLEKFVRLSLVSEARRMQNLNTTPPPIPR